MRTWFFVLLIMITLSVRSLGGELTFNKVALSLGSIQSFEGPPDVSSNVFYPELQLQGGLFAEGVGWEGFWGYWDDKITEVDVYDAIVYSSTGHMIGLRALIEPQKLLPQFPLPIALWGGLGHSFISRTALVTSDGWGNTGEDYSFSANSWEWGGRVVVGLTAQIGLQVEARQLFYFGDEIPGKDLNPRWNVNFGVGIRI